MQWNLGRPVIRNPLIGRRVRLDRCNNPESHVRPGSLGTIGFVDSLGTVHVNWDDGADLGLVPGKDRWTLLTDDAAWPSIRHDAEDCARFGAGDASDTPAWLSDAQPLIGPSDERRLVAERPDRWARISPATATAVSSGVRAPR